jgi:hypothetical protein
MDIISRSAEGLQKLNPREVPKEKELPSSFAKFLKKAPKPKSVKIQSSLSRTFPSQVKPPSEPSAPKPKSKLSNDLYLKQLEFSRNYASYIKDDSGKSRDDIFPDHLPEIPKKIPKHAEFPEKSKPLTEDSRALVNHLIKPKKSKNPEKKGKLRGQGLLQGPLIWCARCSKEHPKDFHLRQNSKKSKLKLPLKRLPVMDEAPERFYRKYEDSEASEASELSDCGSEEDSFIVSDDEYEKTKNLVRKITGFDPSRYKDIDRQSTRDMEASAAQVLFEDRRSAKIGRMEDLREEELERKRLRKKH